MSAGNEVLTQDELDALLDRVDDGAVPPPPAAPGEVRLFDFASQERIVRGRLPTLDMINERFLRLWRIGLFGLLRRAPEVSVLGVQMQKFGEYAASLQVPTSLNLVRMKPFRGTALVLLEPKLVFAVVDNFFGGVGKYPTRLDGREFTPSENRVIELLLRQILGDLQQAWTPVQAVEFEKIGSEINPQYANVITPREYVVVTRFRVELEGAGGEMHVAMPWSMLEPIREQLEHGVQTDRIERDESFSHALRDQLPDAEVEVSATLARLKSSLRHLLQLKPGDILPFDMPARLTLDVEQMPLFDAEYGIANGQRALRIHEPRPPAARRRNPAGASA